MWSEVGDREGDTVIYQIQVDDNPDFSSPVISAYEQQRASHTPGQPLADGTYCWRVRSIDDIQAASPFTPAFAVTVASKVVATTDR
jgi:hypothetical protein